jgi:hypothetical protein
VVTSRATGDDLIDDEDTQASDIVTPLSQPLGKSAAAVSDGTAGGGISPNGAPPAGKDDTAKAAMAPGAVDATIVDGVPALPADTISPSRGSRPEGADQGKPADQAVADDGPTFAFGPPLATPATGAAAGTGAGLGGGAGSPDGTGSSAGPGSSGPSAWRPGPDGRQVAEAPSVSPAAFAWEMPDPPANSRSSPARAFLRSGLTAKKPAGSKTGPSAGPGKAAAAGAAAAKTPGAQGAQSKRTARQAHLTVARVEPWSVMKFSFVVSLVAFVILFVAVSVLYGVLSGIGVFDSLQRVVSSVTSSQSSSGVNAKAWFSASRVLGYTALLGSLNIVLITAMSTIGAVVYNLTSRLVGGVEVTLRETE